jgi:hypothetical protein
VVVKYQQNYIDDAISLNTYQFGDYDDRVYTIELGIKDTTDTAKSASSLQIIH